MTLALIRDLGKTTSLCVALAALAITGLAFSGTVHAAPAPVLSGDAADDFQEGVSLLRQGKKDAALQAFQRALASDPSNDAAYELWKSTDEQLFLDMLVEGGEFELVAKRFLDRARIGRSERRNDADAIATLVGTLQDASNSAERRAAISALSAEHGEYAVPRLVRALADSTDEDWRIIAMHTLTQMDSDVVLPLIEALNTSDAYQRANVAMVLGHIGDGRAAAALSLVAGTDADGKVQRAALKAATKCGSNGSSEAQYMVLGEDYYYRRDNVLRDFDYSDVTWSWDDGSLSGSSIPRSVYHSTLSKRAYMAALSQASTSTEALAGVARAAVDISTRLNRLAESGEDISDHQAAADGGPMIAASCGVEALDLALHWSVVADDPATGAALAQVLSACANTGAAGLQAALGSSDGSLRGEAAVAMGTIAARTGSGASDGLVSALGDAAGREIMRLVAVIDSDSDRANSLSGSIGGPGVLVNHRDTGAGGISLLRRVSGFDAIVVGDQIGDMTVDQVLAAASLDGSDTPIFLVSSDENTADAYSDRVTGVISDLSDLSELDSVFEASLTGDRARADDLSRRAAEVLGALAHSGTDISAALGGLAQPIGHRADGVTLAALGALASAGTPAQAGGILAVITDESRSDAARTAAGRALAGIFGRNDVSGDDLAGLAGVVLSDASLSVRTAAAQAIGLARLNGSERAGLVGDI